MLAGVGAAAAQPYPSRPVVMVVPFGAGGPIDTVARILGEGMRASLGQQVVIENVTGASGTIGVGRVVRAAPDGYTVSIGNWPTHVVNGAIFRCSMICSRTSSPSRACPAILTSWSAARVCRPRTSRS